MTEKKLDAAMILRRLAEIRNSIPYLDTNAPPPKTTSDGRLADIRTAEDFEYATVAEGMESLADELSAAIERKYAEATEAALEVYYTAEELARDPAHADLIPHVQRMREAYERQYGKPIPPKGKG